MFSPAALTEKRQIVQKLGRLLRARYGQPQRYQYNDPLDALIQTILSQNTSDLNSGRAFAALRTKYPTWESARLARPSDIEETIRSGGLAKTKARRIHHILNAIYKDFGQVSLRCLLSMSPEQASETLSAFHGVGPKTVNCVLLFGCRMDVFPVDTHILRLSKRLGVLEENVSLERAHLLWAQLAPHGSCLSLHLNLIEHGRRVCRPRNPRCPACMLKSLCAYYGRAFKTRSK